MALFLICWLLPSILASPPQTVFRSPHATIESSSGSSKVGWYDPRLHGGRFLDFAGQKYGEPLNVIISGLSDPFILTDDGFHQYARSLDYGEECLGLHAGLLHNADLGDGDGRKVQHYLARQFYVFGGTCWESLAGGQHFRAWKQNGSLADSGAWFIGASKEFEAVRNHAIVPDGYNIGRDWLVDRASKGSHWKRMWWNTTVEWREDLLEEGKKGINHGIAQDGRVAILTVIRV